jgi:hypothetical protein
LNVDIKLIGERSMSVDLASRLSAFAMAAFVVLTAWTQTVHVPLDAAASMRAGVPALVA